MQELVWVKSPEKSRKFGGTIRIETTRIAEGNPKVVEWLLLYIYTWCQAFFRIQTICLSFFYYPTEECPSSTLDDGHLFDVTVVEREKRGKGNLAMT
jgi:hypothetical protein